MEKIRENFLLLFGLFEASLQTHKTESFSAKDHLCCSILGIQLEALAFELCGTIIRQVEADSCVARDGRLKPGDLILYLNHECLWRVTSSQAKTILRRAELVSNAIP